MYLAALVTGGKDSILALYRILQRGYKVKNLVTMIPQREDSWMFHFPNIHLTDLLAEAIGIPLVKGKTVGIKEKELEDLKKTLSNLHVDGVVHGAISSRYQKERIERICQELNLKSFAPLWQENPINLLKEMIDLNFQIIIVGVYAHGLDQSWLGRKINEETIEDLIELSKRYQISPVGEGGEYETLVTNAPFFKKKIQLLKIERIWENHSGYLNVIEAKLVDKNL
ncbi:TIGR00289 family protein [Candidatus Bathyarchaeota archaeon]|nr:TIGR00289 family protein [Candidatus Bathyarchaeota archaeon]